MAFEALARLFGGGRKAPPGLSERLAERLFGRAEAPPELAAKAKAGTRSGAGAGAGAGAAPDRAFAAYTRNDNPVAVLYSSSAASRGGGEELLERFQALLSLGGVSAAAAGTEEGGAGIAVLDFRGAAVPALERSLSGLRAFSRGFPPGARLLLHRELAAELESALAAPGVVSAGAGAAGAEGAGAAAALPALALDTRIGAFPPGASLLAETFTVAQASSPSGGLPCWVRFLRLDLEPEPSAASEGAAWFARAFGPAEARRGFWLELHPGPGGERRLRAAAAILAVGLSSAEAPGGASLESPLFKPCPPPSGSRLAAAGPYLRIECLLRAGRNEFGFALHLPAALAKSLGADRAAPGGAGPGAEAALPPSGVAMVAAAAGAETGAGLGTAAASGAASADFRIRATSGGLLAELLARSLSARLGAAAPGRLEKALAVAGEAPAAGLSRAAEGAATGGVAPGGAAVGDAAVGGADPGTALLAALYLAGEEERRMAVQNLLLPRLGPLLLPFAFHRERSGGPAPGATLPGAANGAAGDAANSATGGGFAYRAPPLFRDGDVLDFLPEAPREDWGAALDRAARDESAQGSAAAASAAPDAAPRAAEGAATGAAAPEEKDAASAPAAALRAAREDRREAPLVAARALREACARGSFEASAAWRAEAEELLGAALARRDAGRLGGLLARGLPFASLAPLDRRTRLSVLGLVPVELLGKAIAGARLGGTALRAVARPTGAAAAATGPALAAPGANAAPRASAPPRSSGRRGARPGEEPAPLEVEGLLALLPPTRRALVAEEAKAREARVSRGEGPAEELAVAMEECAELIRKRAEAYTEEA